jgi:hypothetical protein
MINVRKGLKRINDTLELSRFIQRLSTDELLYSHKCVLSVNESSTLAKKLRLIVKKNGYKNFMENCEKYIHFYAGDGKTPKGSINATKQTLVMELIRIIFADVNRWTIFSKSKKMMNKIILYSNDKS